MREETIDERAETSKDLADIQVVVEEDHGVSSKAQAIAGVAALSTLTAACGGGGGSSSGSNPPVSGGTPAPTIVKPETDAAAARFLLRAGLSASTGTITQIKDEGYEPWLDRQMARSNDSSGASFHSSRGYDDPVNEKVFDRNIGDNMLWAHLLAGNSQVRRRFALALSEFFVVSLNGANLTWPGQAAGAWWDLLNDHAFGNFRDLIEEVSLNPLMGVYLNTRGNKKADPRKGRVPDENYGREVMQLFSIGLYELNLDGTRRTSGGEPIETYDNDDVTGIAKAFTGYDFDFDGIALLPNPNNPGNTIPHPDFARQRMTADTSRWQYPRSESFHSDEEKSFLGTTIPAGTGPEETLRITLDALFNHPNVAPFFSQQMIQRLVTSNPTPAYVRRVAQVFENNGSGTRGDMGAVFKAILLDDEALSDAGLTDARYGKLREPMIRLAQWGRTFGASSDSGEWNVRNLADSSGRLGQSPLRSPSVFNFFRPGYVPSGSQSADNDLVAPEFQIVNETSVAGYVNAMERVIDGRAWYMGDVRASYSAELGIAHDAQALLDRLDLLLTANQLSDPTRDTILAAMQDREVTETSDDETKLDRIHIGVLLVMASNDYMVQR
ncbi:hypothetical protein BPTFM16_01218 [Altererythrobacter insulae]|nr:hypothetical protein BPTFM16_01218 [Altererythrobacter insulae]